MNDIAYTKSTYRLILMKEIDIEMLRKWKAGMDQLNLIDLDDRRLATYQERCRSMVMIWKQAKFLNIVPSETIDLTVNAVWQKLRTAYLNSNA
jgi:hypothetical protein